MKGKKLVTEQAAVVRGRFLFPIQPPPLTQLSISEELLPLFGVRIKTLQLVKLFLMTQSTSIV